MSRKVAGRSRCRAIPGMRVSRGREREGREHGDEAQHGGEGEGAHAALYHEACGGRDIIR
jgi:hypothetical protein